VLGIKDIRPGAQSPKIIRGGVTSGIKYSSFRDSHIKLNASRDSKGQKEKVIRNV
jgi:hypothetical protein